MSVAFVTSWALSAGNATAGAFTSAAFTPTNNGDAILVFAFDLTSAATVTVAGSVGSYTSPINPPGNFVDGTHVFTESINTNSANSSQTVTSTSTGTDFMLLWQYEYSGVSSFSGTSGKTVVNPGTGSGAITGNGVTAPTGSIVLAFCYETSGGSGALTSPSGTNRNNGALGVSYCVTEYAGAGSTITPSFTGADGAAATYDVIQVLLSPAATATLPIPSMVVVC